MHAYQFNFCVRGIPPRAIAVAVGQFTSPGTKAEPATTEDRSLNGYTPDGQTEPPTRVRRMKQNPVSPKNTIKELEWLWKEHTPCAGTRPTAHAFFFFSLDFLLLLLLFLDWTPPPPPQDRRKSRRTASHDLAKSTGH